MKYLCVMLIGSFLIGCSTTPSDQEIQTAIAQTQIAQVTATSTPTSEQIYTNEMVQVILQLDQYFSLLNQWDDLYYSYIPGHGDLTYGQALSLLPVQIDICETRLIMGLNCTKKDYMISLQRDLIPIARSISEDGFALRTIWNSVEPPIEVRFPHEQIDECIQYKINLANELIELIDQSIINTGELNNPCGNVLSAISAIRQYVESNTN